MLDEQLAVTPGLVVLQYQLVLCINNKLTDLHDPQSSQAAALDLGGGGVDAGVGPDVRQLAHQLAKRPPLVPNHNELAETFNV